jgi:hypothetical protein
MFQPVHHAYLDFHETKLVKTDYIAACQYKLINASIVSMDANAKFIIVL